MRSENRIHTFARSVRIIKINGRMDSLKDFAEKKRKTEESGPIRASCVRLLCRLDGKPKHAAKRRCYVWNLSYTTLGNSLPGPASLFGFRAERACDVC